MLIRQPIHVINFEIVLQDVQFNITNKVLCASEVISLLSSSDDE